MDGIYELIHRQTISKRKNKEFIKVCQNKTN